MTTTHHPPCPLCGAGTDVDNAYDGTYFCPGCGWEGVPTTPPPSPSEEEQAGDTSPRRRGGRGRRPSDLSTLSDVLTCKGCGVTYHSGRITEEEHGPACPRLAYVLDQRERMARR